MAENFTEARFSGAKELLGEMKNRVEIKVSHSNPVRIPLIIFRV